MFFRESVDMMVRLTMERAARLRQQPPALTTTPFSRGTRVVAAHHTTSPTGPVQDPPGCKRCGSPTRWLKRKGRFSVFCGLDCDRAWRSEKQKGKRICVGFPPPNVFKPGHVPWNKHLKGIHLSPATQFKPGPRPDMRDALGAVKVRKCKGGNCRAFVKVAQPNRWRLRAVVVWEAANGPIPKGSLVHHKNRDSLDDRLENLQCMTRAEHIAEHRDDLLAAKARKGEGQP